MSYKTTIELFKEDMKFSAGHFTVFSATERERLHGHNFKVRANLTLEVGSEGLGADYKIFKTKLRQICNDLDEYFLLPIYSPHLKIQTAYEKVLVEHNQDQLIFLTKDIKLLPISNTTIEELSKYLTELLIADTKMLQECKISAIEVKVGSGDGQYAAYHWEQT
jgi:6-pyruvoyltetrahydropterin/6-carboxytetrahydropterin synthase